MDYDTWKLYANNPLEEEVEPIDCPECGGTGNITVWVGEWQLAACENCQGSGLIVPRFEDLQEED